MGGPVQELKKYVGNGAVTIETSLERSFNGLTQLEHIVDKHLTEAEKKLLVPKLEAFKTVLTDLGANPQDQKAFEAALKQSTALTKQVGELLNKTAALSDVVDKTSSIKGMTPRIAVVGYEFRDSSEGLRRGLEYAVAEMSGTASASSAVKQTNKPLLTVAEVSAEALKPAKLELIKGGDYRLTYDATNLQGNSHQAAKELLDAAKRQDITARVSYQMVENRREITIVFDGTAKAGKLLRVHEATALFVDTANLFAESAQKHAALGQGDRAAKDLSLARKFNPIAGYTSADFSAVSLSAADKVKVVAELKPLQENLSANLKAFAKLTQADRLEFIPKTQAAAADVVVGLSSEASSLTLAKAARGVRLLGTAGLYASLLEGMVAATATVSDKLHEADLKDAREAEARLNYAGAHTNLRNDDAVKAVELNR